MPLPDPLPTFRTAAQRERDVKRVGDVHPYLAHKLLRILDALEVLGFPMFVTEGLRSDARQLTLWRQGRETPGKIVTNANGIPKAQGGTGMSMHQRQSDGYAHAVDCAFLDDPLTVKIETWDPKQPWDIYGRMGEHFGCTWGGRWTSPFDRPHLELSMSSPFATIPTPTDDRIGG